MRKKPIGVLILHGFTSSLDCVNLIEPPVKALGLPVRMPVLRGHGKESPEAMRGVTWQDWVADGEAALNSLLQEAEKAVVFGHSMGALVALHLAADHTDAVDSIILAAPAVQMAAPLAPGRPLHFLVPLIRRLLTKWNMPPVYADPALARYNTNYPWAPIESVVTLLDFADAARRRLPEIRVPAFILQSRRDTVVAPESAEIVYNAISTPAGQKRIIWFEATDHEMFLDCEREKTVAAVVNCVQERLGLAK